MSRVEISQEEITKKVCQLVIDANTKLPLDLFFALKAAKEKDNISSHIFDILLKNAHIAMSEGLPICQDTGIYAVFVEVGKDIEIRGDLEDAINEGIRQATKRGYLRASVCDPITRKNTFDNTPAIVHTKLTQNSELKITIFPKGCGSENMSALKMLPPSSGLEGVADFVVERVRMAGPNPCPPGIIGVGIGGTMEKAAYLSKKALLRPLKKNSENKAVAELEKELLKKINNLGIGPLGLGGSTTTLNVAIETFPCHIASLPVAINIQCHAARKASAIFKNGKWQHGDREHIFSSLFLDDAPHVNFENALKLNLPLEKSEISNLKAGTWVLLSGELLTGRDQTHKKLCELIEENRALPVDLKGAVIYYMGPSPAPPGKVIGSAGPTTSYRMDSYTPTILKQGVVGLIGKGKRSKKVKDAIKEHGAVYFATIGGAGAFLSKKIKKCELLAFKELGPEALFRLYVEDFPAIVINDCFGNDYYEMVEKGIGC